MYINVLLIFDIYDVNGALFLKASFLFILLPSLVPIIVIVSYAIYVSLQSHKSDLSIEVLNLIFLLTEY